MGLGETHKLNAKDREFWTVLVLVVREAQIENGATSMWTDLTPFGSILLGGELDKKPKDSVWWVTDTGKQRRLNKDFGKFKKAIKQAAKFLGVDDALKARNKARWANALAVTAVVGGIVATVATGGAAAAIIGPMAAGILATTGAVVGTTAAALQSMVANSGDGLTLSEMAEGLKDGEEYWTTMTRPEELEEGEGWTMPEREEWSPGERPGVLVQVGLPRGQLPGPTTQPRLVPREPVTDDADADDKPAEEGVDIVPLIVGGVLLTGAAVAAAGALIGVAYFATRRAA